MATIPEYPTATTLQGTELVLIDNDGTTGNVTVNALMNGTGPQRRLMARMTSGIGPGYVTILGDSTSAGQGTLGYKLSNEYIAPAHPTWTVQYRPWNDTNQGYERTEYFQVGTAGLGYYSPLATTTSLTTPATATTTLATCDMMIRAHIRVTDFTDGAGCYIASHYGASGNRSWWLQINTSGALVLRYSANGTAVVDMTLLSTAELAAEFADNTDVYIGCTFLRNNGSNAAGRAIKSTDDGVTWTEIGSLKTNTSIAGLFASTQTIEVGTNQTVGGLQGRIYWVEVFKGVVDTSPLAWRFDANAYTFGTSSNTFTDGDGNVWSIAGLGVFTPLAPSLTVYNGSVGGTGVSYADDPTRRPLLTCAAAQMIIVNFGHNETVSDITASYMTLVANLRTRWPGAGIVAVIQNPQKTTATNWRRQNTHQNRIADLVSSDAFGVINLWQAFVDTGDPDALINVDGVHPSAPAGYAFQALAAAKSFALP